MRLTKREDYTFFLMSKLAQSYGKGLLSLSEVADEYGISAFFLKQLVRPLVRAKLLISKEGIGGGYSLAKRPSEITLFEVFNALSSLPSLTACCQEKNASDCQRIETCKPRFVWNKINKGILQELSRTKLSQLK